MVRQVIEGGKIRVHKGEAEFCQKLKPFPLTKERAAQDSQSLTPTELTGFRAILGALIWLCQTRLDVVCDVVLHQQEVGKATIGTLKLANSVITKAKKYSWNCGLYFPFSLSVISVREDTEGLSLVRCDRDVGCKQAAWWPQGGRRIYVLHNVV